MVWLGVVLFALNLSIAAVGRESHDCFAWRGGLCGAAFAAIGWAFAL